MAQLSSSLFIKLIDGVTRPARGMAQSITGIGKAFQGLSGAGAGALTAGLTRAIETNRRTLAKLRGDLFDTGAMGFTLYHGLSKPLAIARDFETMMLDIGQKADLSDGKIAGLAKSIRRLARDINLTPQQTAGGVDILAGMGLDPDKALNMMGPIGKAATAYGAQVDDLARAGFAAFDNLKLKPEQFAKALDIMAQSGKEGAFELKDMAMELPQLTSGAQALGMSGTDGVAKLSAALQIARKGAGTSAEAATNVANLMQKIISQETTNKFKKAGIDIRAELKKVQKGGGDVFEFIAGKIMQATDGDLSRLGDFFQDAQVQQFLRPLIQNLGEYKRIRDRAADIGPVVDQDFARRMKTGAAQLRRFTTAMNDLGLTIGSIILPAVNSLLEVIAPLVNRLADFAGANPVLSKSLVGVAAGLVGFRVAAIGLRYGLSLTKAGVLEFALALTKLTRSGGRAALLPLIMGFRGVTGAGLAALRMLRAFVVTSTLIGFRGASLAALRGGAGAFLGLLNPIRLVRIALLGLRAAVISTGIGAILIGIAMAGTWIYNNWHGLTEMFSGFADRIAEKFPALRPIFDNVSSWVSWLIDKVGSLTGTVNATDQEWRNWGVIAANGVIHVIDEIKNLIDLFLSLPSRALAAARGVAQAFSDVVFGVSIPGKSASGAAGTFSSRGGGGRGSSPAPALAGARASGGPVLAGKSYVVGERGVELFSPRTSGHITPNHHLPRSAGGGNVHIRMGNIIINGVQNVDQLTTEISARLEAKLRQMMRGLQADPGFIS